MLISCADDDGAAVLEVEEEGPGVEAGGEGVWVCEVVHEDGGLEEAVL